MGDDTSSRNGGASTEGRDNRGRFAPGNRGRLPGTRNRATAASQALLDGQAERLTQAAIDAALSGDTAALKLCLDRLLPPRKDMPVRVALPTMETAADAAAALSGVLEAVARGRLTPDEGTRVAGLVETFRRTLETEALEARIAALETERGAP